MRGFLPAQHVLVHNAAFGLILMQQMTEHRKYACHFLDLAGCTSLSNIWIDREGPHESESIRRPTMTSPTHGLNTTTRKVACRDV